MVSKLCTHGTDRNEAISRMLRALDEYEITCCKTTIPFCRYVMQHKAFKNGTYDTHFVKDLFNN